MQKIDKIEIQTAVSTDKIVENIADARKRFISPIYDCPAWREGMPIAIVGGGPSLSGQLDKLREYKYIMACGSVHDYLIKNNIIPNWCVVCDPDPIMVTYLQHLRSKCYYLLSSQCSPELFDYFEKSYVPFRAYLWHCDGLHFDRLHFGEKAIVTGGGCTVGTRAMALALQFGYYNPHLFGFDTCIESETKHHAYDFINPEVETIGNVIEIQLDGPDSPKFLVAGYMLGQYFDFKDILSYNASRLNVTIHGGGLLAYHMELAHKKADEFIKEREKINGD